MIPISKQIKERMTQRGVSVHALEKQAGLKNSAIHNILYGRSKNPSINTLLAIAQALECDVSDLLVDSSLSSRDPSKDSRFYDEEPPVWSPDLYIDTLKTIHNLSLKYNVSLSKIQLFSCADEVYAYALKHKRTKPDKHFAEWILEKNL